MAANHESLILSRSFPFLINLVYNNNKLVCTYAKDNFNEELHEYVWFIRRHLNFFTKTQTIKVLITYILSW